jgi:integrase
MRRSGSRNRYYVRRIPADVRRAVAGLALAIPVGEQTQSVTVSERAQSVRLSLRTSDPAEVKRRQAAVDAYLENVWTAHREQQPVSLTHPQAVALAGELYRAWADQEERERPGGIEHDPDFLHPEGHISERQPDGSWKPGPWRRVAIKRVLSEEWDAALADLDRLQTLPDTTYLEPRFGPLVSRLMLARGIARVDDSTREMLLTEFVAALRDAFEKRKRNAEGDYSPDLKAVRFPEWPSPRSSERLGGDVSLTGLVEGWWKEAQATGRKPSTYESYRRTVAAFVSHLGHDEASRVTRDDVVRFKDHRLASVNPRGGQRISPRTVKDSDLAGLKAVLAWAVVNGKLANNPAEGVTIKLGKRMKVRRGFTQAEARAVLRAASHLRQGRERPETFAAKRWVPWLQAYTGARVGEIAQLRKQDVSRVGKHWAITISPDAGTVKSNEARQVVLHPHLIEMGFVAFVRDARPGHLFLSAARDGDVLGPLQGLKNRLSEFVRLVVTSRDVDPTHGWRHRFKTVCREVGIHPEVRDYIQGHATRNVAESYGEITIKAQAKAIARLPRYKV